MKQDAVNKLAYFCDEEDGYSRYVLFLDDRAVMYAYASKNDITEHYPIYISRPEEGAPRIKTKGHAFMDENGEDHIDGVSMQQCVYKYMPWLLADIFVPQDGK